MSVRPDPLYVRWTKKPEYVYIAGPMKLGDFTTNIHQALVCWEVLRQAGFTPYCPHWSAVQAIYRPLKHEEWLEYDFRWLRKCGLLLRLRGDSVGADMECNEASRLGIPIYYSLDRLLKENCSARFPRLWDEGTSTPV